MERGLALTPGVDVEGPASPGAEQGWPSSMFGLWHMALRWCRIALSVVRDFGAGHLILAKPDDDSVQVGIPSSRGVGIANTVASSANYQA